MKQIFKYVLNPNINEMEIPSNTILSVESQRDDIVVYAMVDNEDQEQRLYDFRVFGTGHVIDVEIGGYNFLGTVKMYDGSLMFHVFYKGL